MSEVVIENKTASGDLLQATFNPARGMNMVSFKKNDTEVIDQSTRPLFEERFAGLGALIGPHFHRRNTATLPSLADESKYPHIARVKANGVDEPFSHGIGRYAPWTVETESNRISAVLKGSDEWEGVALKDLEGQDFTMRLEALMTSTGLKLDLSVVSDTDSLVGIHYYYRLPKGDAFVTSDVEPSFLYQGDVHNIPEDWEYSNQQLNFKLNTEADFGFHPAHNPLAGTIRLETSEYVLETEYSSTNDENSWQLFHPKGASYACIEPMSARNPRKPQLSVSQIQIGLRIC